MRHMLAAADAIGAYVVRGRAAFDADPALREAIVFQIIVIGEAAKAVTTADPTVVTDLPHVEWSPLAKMRDKVTHHYWDIDPEVVWATAEEDIPELRERLRAALGE